MCFTAQQQGKLFPQQVFLEEVNGFWIAKVGPIATQYATYEAFLDDWNLIIKY